MTKLSIVIPCHNESGAIPLVMRAIRDVLTIDKDSRPWDTAEVIVVNDASTDSTVELLNQFPFAKVVHLKEKSGYGAALKAGIHQAAGDWIAFFDLDGTYDPSDLIPMMKMAKSGTADVIFGERFSEGKGMPAIRRVGNSLFTWMVSILFRTNLKDVCSGFRIFRKEHKAQVLELSSSGLDFSLALTIWAVKSNKIIKESPIRYHLRNGESKLRVLPDGNRFLWTILREHFSGYGVSKAWK